MKRALPFVLAALMICATSPPHFAAAQTGVIQIMPGTDQVGPATKLTVLIADGGLNGHAGRVDEYEAEDVELVTFTTDRSEVGEAVPDLEETGENTGVFSFTIQLETDEESCDNDLLNDPSFDAVGASNPSVGVCPGDLLSISYDDSHTASGGEAVISLTVEIRSWDPEFTSDGEYYLPGDRATITIVDPDANRDPDVGDSIRDIRVFSDTDIVGKEFSAIETGRNTGVFQLSFVTSLASQGGAIQVQGGDALMVEYTDEFPTDVDATEKTFIFSISIPPIDGPGAIQQQPPRLITAETPKTGNQLTLSTGFTGNNYQLQPFVELFEVRDTEGTTIFLAWQSGTLEPLGQQEIGVLWTPKAPGDYEIRVFAISGFENPQVLSTVEASNVTIA